MVEPQRQRATRLDDDLVAGLVTGELVPASPGRPEQETEIVNAAILLSLLDQERVVLGGIAQVLPAGAAGEQPELSTEKTLAPVGPGLRVHRPPAFLGVQREAVGMPPDQRRDLLLGRRPRPGGTGPVAVGDGDAGGHHHRQRAAEYLVAHRSAPPGTQRVVRGPTCSWTVLVWVNEPIACRPSSRPSPLAP